MRTLSIGIVVLLLPLALPAQASNDACFDPLDWAGEQKAGFKACNKLAGCEICALDSGAAYGLCLAYCEVMECADEQPSATDRACLKIKDTYIQLTGNTALPCEEGRDSFAACGSFLVCVECLDSGDYPPGTCADCAEKLLEYGCINVCEP